MKKIILFIGIVIAFLWGISLVVQMQRNNNNNQPTSPLQLTELPEEKLVDIIVAGIETERSLKDAWRFVQNLALTGRQFDRLTSDPAVIAALSEKVIDAEKELFDFALNEDVGEKTAAMIIRAFIKKGVTEEALKVALLKAAVEGRTGTAIALIKLGIDPNMGDRHLWTPLMFAAIQKNPETVRALINQGAKVNLQHKNGDTALIMAARSGAIDVVKVLVEAGADVTIKGERNVTALDEARTPEIREILRKAGEQQMQKSNVN